MRKKHPPEVVAINHEHRIGKFIPSLISSVDDDHLSGIVHFRWSNPVLDRLTGGTGHTILPSHSNAANQQRPSPLIANTALRNDSYYMATNDTWSPMPMNGNNSVLIEEDPEPLPPYVPQSRMEAMKSITFEYFCFSVFLPWITR